MKRLRFANFKVACSAVACCLLASEGLVQGLALLSRMGAALDMASRDRVRCFEFRENKSLSERELAAEMFGAHQWRSFLKGSLVGHVVGWG
jgi:hypothetical protein